jgi:hypothetical protein
LAPEFVGKVTEAIPSGDQEGVDSCVNFSNYLLEASLFSGVTAAGRVSSSIAPPLDPVTKTFSYPQARTVNTSKAMK